MFIRKKRNSSGSTSIQIIQKIDGKNRVLKSIGCSSDPTEIERLFNLAHEESLRFYGPTLFDNTNQHIGQITNDGIRAIGPELIFGKIYDRIGYNKIKEPLLRSLAISRITHPGSKLKLSEYLQASGESDISVYSIYRFLDKLNTRYKIQIEQLAFDYTRSILGNKIGVVFYDMTTLYFESSQPGEFRIPGFPRRANINILRYIWDYLLVLMAILLAMIFLKVTPMRGTH